MGGVGGRRAVRGSTRDWLEVVGEKGGALGQLPGEEGETTLVTVARRVGGVRVVLPRGDRPAVVVSSTSWYVLHPTPLCLKASALDPRFNTPGFGNLSLVP